MYQQALKQGMEHYVQPKPDGDIDLVATVRQLLMESGLGQRIQVFNENRFVKEANGRVFDAQRFLMNRYWAMQLMEASAPSIDERFCLIPNGTAEDWLKLFKEKVLPFIITHNLPVAISQ